MCGRFPLGLDAQSHRTAIERWMDRQDAQRRRGAQGKGRASGSGSQSQSGRRTNTSTSQPSSSSQHHHQQAQPSQSESHQDQDETQVPQIESTPDTEHFRPSYNIAPSTRVPVMRLDSPVPFTNLGSTSTQTSTSSKPPDHKLLIQPMKWGLLPSSTTSLPPYADALKTINARDDTVLSGRGIWPPLLRSGKRCVVWAQGFYEWLKKPDGTRLPHFVGMQSDDDDYDDQEGVLGRTQAEAREKTLMPMAGLWESCQLDGEEHPTLTFTIITTESNQQLGFLHDRMPVILPDTASVLLWLGVHPLSTSPSHVSNLLKPYQGQLDCYRVPTEVGKVGNSDLSFIQPLSQRKDGIMAAFGRAGGKGVGLGDTTGRGGKEVKREEMEEERKKVDVNSETHAPVTSASPLTSDTEGGSRRREKRDDAEADIKSSATPTVKEEEVITTSSEHRADLKIETSSPPPSHLDTQNLETTRTPRAPSSKFSPEPFNPPISPLRPRGGYSREDKAGQGQSVYTRRGEDKGPTRLEGMLERMRQAGDREAESAKRSLADPGSEIGGREDKRAKLMDSDSKDDQTHITPTRKFGTEGGRTATTKTTTTTTKMGKERTKEKVTPKGTKDIRSFFSGKGGGGT